MRELYWQLVSNVDYRLRDGRAIVDLYLDLGLRLYVSSQDASRWAACAFAGLVRLTTRTCHGRYIGRAGGPSGSRPLRTIRIFALGLVSPKAEAHASAVIADAAVAGGAGGAVGRGVQPFLCSFGTAETSGSRRPGDDCGSREGLSRVGFAQATAALEQGLREFPNALDQEGHAIFRKELLQLLAGFRAWEDIDRLMSRFDDWSAHPWREVVLARAYAASGKAQDASLWWTRALARDDPDARQWFENGPAAVAAGP